ncbi:binding-protein-dependent transport systems inner membrane component [Thermocrinis albus DSM 14484]|uniref:Binding-protein-dependent transport systems inner membrane component n=1 Tax=Thermocrinis albus (strain DSM 14484 / JCM 11386 / HI 11/12) TaxID=638303 RepID=D3SQA8_THEAH|nr:ABC transporter permease [Thermocrinis albus]ADC89345.1 binding-protein-dependent transport systems inner membrane component [Thermocrinis albus DSM 14484]
MLQRDNYVILFLLFIYVGLIFMLWSISSKMIESPLFPSLIDIYKALLNAFEEGFLFSDLKTSIIRITIGWLIAILTGTIIGILVSYYRWFTPLDYINDFFRYLPVPAFLPLTLMWFGIGETSKIFLIFLGVFVQVIAMVANEIRNFPYEYIEVGRSLGMNRHQILYHIILEGIKPNLWDIYRINLGWAWTYLLVGEVAAANEGLGYRLIKSQRFLQMDMIYAYLIVIGLIGLLSDSFFRVSKPLIFKHLRRNSK